MTYNINHEAAMDERIAELKKGCATSYIENHKTAMNDRIAESEKEYATLTHTKSEKIRMLGIKVQSLAI
jgi:hypothetical protein